VRVNQVQVSGGGIRLGQFLKLANLADTGGEAKLLLEAGDVMVNGVVESRRGAQLHPGDVVTCGGQQIRIVSSEEDA
jgi:ribosome-associated protein